VRKPQQTTETKADWKKVGPCLYRYRNGTYYALIKRQGKQFRRSLETTDLAHARRKLPGVRRDLEETDRSRITRKISSRH
jgi:hypothetical protein